MRTVKVKEIKLKLSTVSKLLFMIFAMFSANVFAVIADDTITIKRVYVTIEGSFAVEGMVEIPNASAARDCADGKAWAKFWAGFGSEVDDRVISVILSAHAQKKDIQIRTEGCEGRWHKITSVYIK